MKHRLVLGPSAQREIEEAARWYEARQQGLGQAFIHEVLAALEAIASEPNSFPLLSAPYRRKLLDRFPYGVIYKVTHERVYVRAVAHGRRRPAYWDK